MFCFNCIFLFMSCAWSSSKYGLICTLHFFSTFDGSSVIFLSVHHIYINYIDSFVQFQFMLTSLKIYFKSILRVFFKNNREIKWDSLDCFSFEKCVCSEDLLYNEKPSWYIMEFSVYLIYISFAIKEWPLSNTVFLWAADTKAIPVLLISACQSNPLFGGFWRVLIICDPIIAPNPLNTQTKSAAMTIWAGGREYELVVLF